MLLTISVVNSFVSTYFSLMKVSFDVSFHVSVIRSIDNKVIRLSVAVGKIVHAKIAGFLILRGIWKM